MADLYQLLLMVDGKGVWTFFAGTYEEAEERGRRMVETERKKGVDMTMLIMPSLDVAEDIRQTFAGKGFNLVRQDSSF